MPVSQFKTNAGRTYKVVEANTLSLPRGTESVDVKISDLVFTFKFSSRSGQKTDVRSSQPSGTTLVFELINFDNTFATSFDAKVGSLENKPLFVAITLTGIGDTIKTLIFQYTFYVEP